MDGRLLSSLYLLHGVGLKANLFAICFRYILYGIYLFYFRNRSLPKTVLFTFEALIQFLFLGNQPVYGQNFFSYESLSQDFNCNINGVIQGEWYSR